MTHDPLCRASRASVVCLHCAGENDNRGKSNYCSDCWDHYVGGLDQFEPVHECQCDLIAKAHKRGYEEAEAFYTNSCVSCGYAGEWSTWMCEQCTLEQP